MGISLGFLLISMFIAYEIYFNRSKYIPANYIVLRNYAEYPKYDTDDYVVRIHKNNSFICSGFVVSAQYVVTAAHCVEDLEQTLFIRDSTQAIELSGKVVGIEDSMDQALIQVSIEDKIRPIKMDITGVYIAEEKTPIVSCGYPGGQSQQLCNKGYLHGNYYFLRAGSGSLYRGMSGGPTLVKNETETVAVGINSAVNKQGILIGPLVNLDRNMGVVIIP